MKPISEQDYKHLADNVELFLSRAQIDWYIECMHICATQRLGPDEQTWSLSDYEAFGPWIALMDKDYTPLEACLLTFGSRH
jgi:hypothetical protein